MFVQIENTLLDAILHHKAVDRHRAILADAVRAVGRLVLDSRVPPRIEMDHIIGRRQIEADTAGFEADKEQVALARLKSRYALRAYFENVLPRVMRRASSAARTFSRWPRNWLNTSAL